MDENTTVELAKSVTKLVVGASVGRTVKTVVTRLKPWEPMGRAERVRWGITAYVISGMVADKATDWAAGEVDEFANQASKLKSWYDKNVKKKPEVWEKVTKEDVETKPMAEENTKKKKASKPNGPLYDEPTVAPYQDPEE